MLQITILHERNENKANSVKILEIKDMDSFDVVSKFDDEKGMIDLEPLKSHIGETVLITHFNKHNGCTMYDYEARRNLINVDKDDNGLWFLEYN